MIDALFYWTGAAFWFALLAASAGVLGYGVVTGIANSISIHRWSWQHAKKHGHKVKWGKLPKSFLLCAVDMFGYKNTGSTKITKETGAFWNGIGDWRV